MDVEDLIERLCTMAGMIMEDAASTAILRDDDLVRRVASIVDAGRDIAILAAAAQMLAARLQTAGA